jgi:hypothetical protein
MRFSLSDGVGKIRDQMEQILYNPARVPCHNLALRAHMGGAQDGSWLLLSQKIGENITHSAGGMRWSFRSVLRGHSILT